MPSSQSDVKLNPKRSVALFGCSDGGSKNGIYHVEFLKKGKTIFKKM